MQKCSYCVQAGDTLQSIASDLDTSWLQVTSHLACPLPAVAPAPSATPPSPGPRDKLALALRLLCHVSGGRGG